MDEDDPFLVVKPDDGEKKMSAYLKKQPNHGGGDGSKCSETSSQGTSSTRSTYETSTVSSKRTMTPERKNISIKHTTTTTTTTTNSFGFPISGGSNSGAIEFSSDFGNGLEFGSSAFGDNTTGFPMDSAGGFGGDAFSSDPFADSDFTTNNNNNSSSSSSGKPIDSGFATFENDPFGGAKNFSNHGDVDAFGLTTATATATNNDKPNSTDNLFGIDPFEKGNSNNTSELQTIGKSGKEDDAWRKREAWKKSARTHSSSSGSRELTRGMNRRRGVRRNHSADLNLDGGGGGGNSHHDHSPPRVPTGRGGGGGNHERSPVMRREKSPNRSPKDRERQPPNRTRSNRRERRGGHAKREGENSDVHASDVQGKRRGSVSHTRSDGSLEPAYSSSSSNRAPPRHKSTQIRATSGHLPHGRARRRTSGSHITVGLGGDPTFDPMQLNVPPLRHHQGAATTTTTTTSEKKWEKERSRNQELIMNMYRDGGLSSKNENTKNDSLGDIQIDMDSLQAAAACEDNNASNTDSSSRTFGQFLKNAVSSKNAFGSSLMDNDGEKDDQQQKISSSRKLGGRKQQKAAEGMSDYADNHRSVEGRSRRTLLERVAATDISEQKGPTSTAAAATTTTNASPADTTKGLSYSDRILMAQKRGRN